MFNQTVTWKGYSEIICAFNFEGTNGFSITNLLSVLPSAPNYALCIMYTDTKGVHRFLLWNAVGTVFYFPVALYKNQPIKKNFRLEVWSTNVPFVTNTIAVNFYTTVAGGVDYRYGLDSALVLNDPIVTLFSTGRVLPNDAANNTATDQFDSFGIVSDSTWNPSVGTGSYAEGIGQSFKVNGFGLPVSMEINSPSVEFILSGVTTQHNYYIVVNPNLFASTNVTIEDAGATNFITLVWQLDANNNSQFEIIGSTSATCIGVNEINGAWVSIIGTVATVICYDANGLQVGTCTCSVASFQSSKIFVDVANNFYELIHSNGTYNFQQHLQAIYGGFYLPLIFPSNAAPVINIP